MTSRRKRRSEAAYRFLREHFPLLSETYRYTWSFEAANGLKLDPSRLQQVEDVCRKIQSFRERAVADALMSQEPFEPWPESKWKPRDEETR
jgi:hypothetical protein